MNEPILNIGDQKLSPVSRFSLDIIMNYIQSIENEDIGQKHPLLISLPSKKFASAWLPVGILRNKFVEDYIELGKKVDLETGDYVKIHNSKAKIKDKTSESITLEFKNNTKIKVSQANYAHLISKANRGQLNKPDHFRKNRKREQNNRNAISRILDPKDSKLIVNHEVLNSKILCVTGYGDKGNLENQLDNVEVYGESLSKAFGKDRNIILKPDLKDYEGVFKENKEEESFKNYALEQIQKIENRLSHDNNDLISELRQLLQKGQFTTNDFWSKLSELEDLLEDEDEETKTVRELKELFPGIKESLPENLRAVLVNDLKVLQDYPNTVKGFLKAGIPVVILCDKNVDSEEDYYLVEDVLKQQPDIFRFNWDKEKINAIIGEVEENFIDDALWKASKRFAKQQIKLIEGNDNELDQNFYNLPKKIYELEGYDKIKQAFWDDLYPVGYMIKNTPNQIDRDHAGYFIDNFRQVFREIGGHLPDNLTHNIQAYLDALDSISDSHKQLDYNEQVFRQRIDLGSNENLQIPQNHNSFNIRDQLSENLKAITFTGEPFREKRQKLLLEAVIRHFIPRIKVLCWPSEKIKIQKYLERGIKSGHFTDNLKFYEGSKVNKHLVNNESELKDRINKQIIVEKTVSENNELQAAKYLSNLDFEKIEENLEGYIHSKYQGQTYDEVECSILNLSGGRLLFLPFNSKVKVASPTKKGGLKLEKLSFNKLRSGMTVCEITVDNSDVRNYAREVIKSKADSAVEVEDLDIWREYLETLFNYHNKYLDSLTQFLEELNYQNKLGASPNRGNIKRWLFDDDLLAPEYENMYLILSGYLKDYSKESIEAMAKRIYRAKKEIIKINNVIRKMVKDNVSKKLPANLNEVPKSSKIRLNDKLSAEVNFGRIVEKERKSVSVKYSKTRKILTP